MARAKGEPITTWAQGDDPGSLMYLLRNAPSFISHVKQIQPEILEQSERQLEETIRKHSEGKKFPRQLGGLKIRFWEEYREAQAQDRAMTMENVIHGMCQRPYWDRNVLRNPINLAWLIHPPTDEIVLQKEIIQLSMSKLRDIFDADIFENQVKLTLVTLPDGTRQSKEILTKKVNLPLVREIHGILKTMQDRVYGSVLQRTKNESTTKNLNINQNHSTHQIIPGQPKSLASQDLTLDDIMAFQREMQKTQMLLTKALGPGPEDQTLEAESSGE